jgi:hypothetical protein
MDKRGTRKSLPTLDTLRNFLLAITVVELAVTVLPAKSRIEGDS